MGRETGPLPDQKGAAGDTSEKGDTMTDTQIEAQRLLDAAREAQTDYWEALAALEKCLGVDIDAEWDLNDTSLEALMEGAE